MDLIKIWGDIISIKDLLYSTIITVTSTFLFYSISNLNDYFKNAYLGLGITGALIGFTISNILFKPKRNFKENNKN